MKNRIPEKLLIERKIKGVFSINMLFIFAFIIMFMFTFVILFLGFITTLFLTLLICLYILIAYMEIQKVSIYRYFIRLYKYHLNKRNFRY